MLSHSELSFSYDFLSIIWRSSEFLEGLFWRGILLGGTLVFGGYHESEITLHLIMKKIIFSLLAILALILPSASFASSSLEAVRGAVKDGYNFWLYEPEGASKEVAKPVIIFLHGASLCGSDLNRVKRYGTISAIEKGRKIDAFVVAPQNPGGAWSPSKVMNIVDWVSEHHNVDKSRIYVLGMSLGGYGAIDVAAAYPDRIAAAMSFCGGGTQKNLAALNDVPLWIVHGTADRAVSINESDKVVNKMRAADPKTSRLHYDRVPGMNHSRPARFFYLDESYDWLLSHSLNDEGRPVSAKFDITGSSLNAYSGLNHGRRSTARTAQTSSKSKTVAKSKGKSKKRQLAKRKSGKRHNGGYARASR